MPRPRILFVCTLNSVRSPMAAALLDTLGGARFMSDAAGVQAEPINPFAIAVMMELGVDVSGYIAKTLYDLPRAVPFDQTIALSPPAFEAANSFPASLTGSVLFWDIAMPPPDGAPRERQLASYRMLRDDLRQRIVTHFSL